MAMLLSRAFCVYKGKVRLSYFRTFSTPIDVPEFMAKTSRNYLNLFEYPVLFYAACLVVMVTNNPDPLQANLAWTFVGARYLHSLVHTTYNNVNHRMVVFFVSVLSVLAMWVRIFISL